MVAEVVAASTPGVIAAAGLVARISKGPSRRAISSRRDDVALDQAQTSYLVQTTGDFRQTPGRGGGRSLAATPCRRQLNPYSIGRIDRALVARVDPDPAVRRSHIGPAR